MGRFDDFDNDEEVGKLSTKSQKEFEAFKKLTKVSVKDLNKLEAGIDEAINHFKGRIETRKKNEIQAGLKGGFDESTRKENAKDGFMGTVNMKTLFTVGEKGKREHVTRKNNNIFDVGGF